MRRLIPVAMLLLWGCQGAEEVVHPTGLEGWHQAMSQSVQADEILAEVNGRIIHRGEMMAVWEEYPEWSRQEVLDYLIERELLVAEAIERGLLERPEFAFGRKQGMVAALLKEEVEAKAEVDESKEDRLVESLHRQRRIPPGLRASHLVILVPGEGEGEDGEVRPLREEERDPYFEEGRAYIDEARTLLNGRVDDDALRAVSARLNDEVLPSSFEAAVNEHLLFPRINEQFTPDQLPSTWTPVAAEFARGAETVATDERRGTLSEPVRSQFGWHLIRVDAVIEEAPVTPEAMQRFVEEQLRLDAQINQLGRMVELWFEGGSREVYPERLEDRPSPESF